MLSENFENELAKIKVLVLKENNRIVVKDFELFEKKLRALAEGHANKLQLVTDYDETLTKKRSTQSPCSFTLLNECPTLTNTYRKKVKELYDIYRPIELDDSLPKQEKVQHLKTWWKKSDALLEGFKVEPNEIQEVANKYTKCFRNGVKDLFFKLEDKKVPILIFSAGIGDTIQAVLKTNKLKLSNVKVISNFLEYDENGALTGRTLGEVIHTLNKGEHAMHGYEYYDLIKDRENCILMGDVLNDAEMAEGLPNCKNIFKIGFLNYDFDKKLPKYSETFDIVLVNDETMEVPNLIFDLILNNE